MTTHLGTAVESYVTLNGECPMAAEVRGKEIQFSFGPSTGMLCLVTNKQALDRFLALAQEVVSRLKLVPPGVVADFKVPQCRGVTTTKTTAGTGRREVGRVTDSAAASGDREPDG